MSKRQIQTKAGFTIIEVVLVLAIAGLIFMMVFLALPALQRAQRDTQRADDIARLQAAINSYQANNRGRLPEGNNGMVLVNQSTGKADTLKGATKWADFYNRYVIVGTGAAADVFEDPSGGPYALYINDCSSVTTAGADCAKQPAKWEFDKQAAGASEYYGEANAGLKNVILITLNAICNGEEVKKATGARKVAITYKKEGGGTVCLNN